MLRALDIYTRAAMAEDHPGVDDELREQLECNVCTDLLLNPVTTPCGHTFCKECLSRAVDVRNQCPLCRTILLVGACAEIPVNVTLASVISKLLPASLAARRERAAQEAAGTRATDGATGREGLLSIFVMSEMFPYQKMQLNIFEPRYRLLVRRAMEGNRRFGMVEYDRGTGGMKSLGCEVEITQCDPLPDGRFHINVAGRRRIRVLSSRFQDGYALATVRYLRDDDDDLVPCPDLTSIMRDSVRDALAEMETLEDDEYVKRLMSLVQNTARDLQETTSKTIAKMRRPPTPDERRHFRAHHAHLLLFLHQVAGGVPLETADAEELSWSLAQTTRALQDSEARWGEVETPSFLSIATARDRMILGLHCLCDMTGIAHELCARFDKQTDDGDGEGEENGEDADDDMDEDGDVEEEEEEEEDVDEEEDENENEEEEEE